MKKSVVAAISLLILLARPVSAQTVTSVVENVSITGTGFAAGDTVTASPSGTACTNVIIVSATSITATCPDGTSTVTVKAPPPPPPTTYAFILCANACSPKTPTSLQFTATVGGATPAAQTLDIFDTSPNCPPVPPVPYCGWPNTTVATDSSWLKVSAASGTTEFNDSVSVVLTGLAAGTYNGNVIITQKLFTTPTLKVPVTLTVAGAPVVHKVALSWTPGPVVGSEVPATSFNVDRAATTAGPFALIGTSTTAAYTDLNVTGTSSYCYEVFGVAGGIVSPPSNTLCVTIPGTASSKRSFWKRFKRVFT